MSQNPDGAPPPLVDIPARGRALALAARHINASIPEAAPLSALRTGAAAPEHAHNLHAFLDHAFLDETDTATIADLVISRAIAYSPACRHSSSKPQPAS